MEHTHMDEEKNIIREPSSVDKTLQDISNRTQTYHDQKDIQNILLLREILSTMPRFAKAYFRAVESTTSTRTRVAYAYDIRTFFRFLQEATIQIQFLTLLPETNCFRPYLILFFLCKGKLLHSFLLPALHKAHSFDNSQR